MKTIKIGKRKVVIYDSIEDLPILRFHKYNKMLLIDAGVGSDLADYDRKMEKALTYLSQSDVEHATTELDNMRQNIYFIQTGLSPKNLAFAVLVKSVDGVECDDLSDDGLTNVLDNFKDVTHKEMTAHIDAVKKKIDEELQLCFPVMFDDATIKEYYDKIKERTIAVLRAIIQGDATEEDSKEISDITNELITYFKPHIFAGKDSIEIRYDKQFDNLCLVLSKNLHVNPKLFTVREYYNAYEYLQEEIKQLKKLNK